MKSKLSAALKKKRIEALADELSRLMDRLNLGSVTIAAKKIYFCELQKVSRTYKEVVSSVTPEEAPIIQKMLDEPKKIKFSVNV